MRYIVTVVEQLDRALGELGTDHPINNRLALVLIDNAAELVLHHRCQHQVERDKHYRFFKHHLTQKQRSQAVGPYLDGKLKVLEQLGDISPAERTFIKIAHDYRGELYHLGLRHDDLIRAMAGRYFALCCDLFVRLDDGSRTSRSDDKFTAVADKYLRRNKNGFFDVLGLHLRELSDRLLAQLPGDFEPLPVALSASLERAIDNLQSAFDFLVADNFAGLDADEVLKNAQWQVDLEAHLEEVGTELLPFDANTHETISAEVGKFKTSWRPKFLRVNWDGWRKRCAAIRRETDSFKALSLFEALHNDMAYLDNTIMHAAVGLDIAIQREVDRARGK